MKKVLLTLFVSLFSVIAFAERADVNKVKFSNAKLEQKGDKAVLTFTAETNKAVRRGQVVTFVPRLESGTVTAEQFMVSGKRRTRVDARKAKLSGVQTVGKRYANNNKIEYTYTTTFQPWMKDAKLFLDRSVKKCCKVKTLSSIELPLNVVVTPPVVIAAPVVKQEPVISDIALSGDLAIHFLVGKYNFLPAYKSNESALVKIVAEINKIKDSAKSISEIIISGFASPEGSSVINSELGENRGLALKEQLAKQTGIDVSTFKVINGKENWSELRNLVVNSNMKGKDALLKVIDSDADNKTKNSQIARLSGGRTYSYILKNFYPVLRNAGSIKVVYEK